MAASSTAAVSRVTNSSWTDSCTIAVPSDVQRWPAVPKPLKSAPSTARSSVASGITTSGFFPPSSRQADWPLRPVSSPIREPTADEPVNPTLSTSPSSSARSRPAKAVGPSLWTRLKTPPGTPPAWNSRARASPVAGAYSAGFHTTALPHRIAGTRYHDGTATGKLPAVMIAATPTGVRKVKSCLSGISLGTVCPYRRRPSERKKSQVSMISCTSPSDSGYGLPISRVTSRASASLLSSTMRPICLTTLPRTGAGTAAHSRCAARAARQASTNTPASPSCTSQMTSSRFAGLRDSTRSPSARSSPPMIDAMVLVSVMLMVVAYRRRTGLVRRAQAPLERLELPLELVRQLVPELGEVLVQARQLPAPFLGVHAQQLRDRLVGQIEARCVERVARRHQADRRLLRPSLAVAALEHPREHAAVLAEARPQELAAVLAEPVDHEDLRQLRALAAADLEPVPEVVGHVVAAEGQHRHRVEAQLADRTGGSGRLLGAHDRAHEHAVLPVERLGHERHHRGAASAEQERVDRHALGVLPVIRDGGALLGRRRAPRRQRRRGRH